MQRRLELDAARGLMLVWMTLTHLPTIASTVANQPFGFVSAAEGFIFLSALFTGRIYSTLAERQGEGAMRRRLWGRTVRLYAYHLALLLFAFLVESRIAARGHRPGLYNLLDFYFAVGPKRAMIDAALLIYRPPLLDILPMYILFLAGTPLVLSFTARRSWKPVFAVSAMGWLAAQFGLRRAAHDWLTRLAHLHVPLNEMGYFDLWAWQLLWLIGLYCGVRWARNDLRAGVWARKLIVPAMVAFPALLALRYAVGRGIELGMFEVSFDKWHLGVVRLVNLAAIAVLLIRFQRTFKTLAVRPLVMLGQASLQVFCAHLLFCFLGLAVMGEAARVEGWRQALLLLVTFSGLFLTARIFGRENSTKTRIPRPPLIPRMEAPPAT